jgi:tRNA A37 threonylcarbamoyladenosine biosynthesis protein TsaE
MRPESEKRRNMENMFRLQLPKPGGGTEEIQTRQSLLLIGANGAGKTRLGTWIESESPQKEKVHRISAQKSLSMPDNTTPKSIDMAEKELLYGHADAKDGNFWVYKQGHRWGRKPSTFLLNDYERLMVYLFSDHTEESAKYLTASKSTVDKVEPPITKLDLVKQVWEKVLPHRELILGGLRIQTCVKGGDKDKAYNASEMSDGERVIFYLIGQCLAAPKDGIIIIDEPEIHLHKSVQVPLWREIEGLRPDCLFVYMTHDVDFAASLHESKKIWLKSFDGSSWSWEIVDEIEGLPEALLIEVLGSRKPVVFVEGENGSYDTSLYRAVLSDYLVVPSGSCSQVIQLVKALKESEQLHHLDVFGIIDRDRRVDSEVSSLQENGIYALEVAEVENLFCVPEIIKVVSTRLARDPDADCQSAAEFVLNKINSELEYQISLRVASEIKFRLNSFNEKSKGKNALREALSSLSESIDVDGLYNESEALFNQAVNEHDYLLALRIYNRKSLARQLSSHLGLAHGELAEFVVRLANSENRSEIKSALKGYFGDFGEKIA